MMSLFLNSPPPICSPLKSGAVKQLYPSSPSPAASLSFSKRRFEVKACFNPIDEPVVKEVLKEPVAFMGGLFAGLLRLDMNEEPLREWVTKTVESSGFAEEVINNAETQSEEEDGPQQIVIE